MDFNAGTTQTAAKTMEHFSIGSLILAHRNAYLSHLKTVTESDTVAVLRTAPLHISTFFPDTVIQRAEEEIARKTRDKLILHGVRVDTTHMNALTRGRITGWATNQINQHGRTLAKDSIRKARAGLPTIHPDQPRVSSHINDNYCVKVLQTGLLAGSKLPTPGKTIVCCLHW